MPRRTEPKRVSAASAERTGFDRFPIDIGHYLISEQRPLSFIHLPICLKMAKFAVNLNGKNEKIYSIFRFDIADILLIHAGLYGRWGVWSDEFQL